MKKIITVVMLVAGLFLGYKGIMLLQDASSSIKIGDLKLSTSDTDERNTAYLYLGGSAVLLIGGIYYIKKGK